MARKKTSGFILKLIYWLTIGLFIVLIYKNVDDYEKLLPLLVSADWILLGGAFLLATGNLLILGYILESNFKVFSTKERFPGYLKETIISLFISITTPFGAAGSNAYLIKYLRDQGFSYLKAIFALASANLSRLLIFAVILTIGLRYLNQQHVLTTYQINTSAILIVITIAMPLGILFAMLLPQFSTNFAGKFVDFVNWFSIKFAKRDIIDNRKVKKYTQEVIDMSTNFHRSIIKFISTLKFSLFQHLIYIAVLYMIYRAYGSDMTITSLIMVYSVLTLFTTIAPTPQGIGFAEGLSQLAAVSIGLGGATSFASIMTYRIFTVWTPALIGSLLLRKKVKES